MLILAIDSATPVAGVALLDGNKLLKEEFSNYKKTHSQTLMPMIDRVLRECECSLDDLAAVAISAGPGSFTGLRIGMATAKGLCLASGKPLVTVATLDALAYNVHRSQDLVCPLLDARKQEVYTCFYDVSAALPRRLVEMSACSPAEFVEQALHLAHKYGRGKILLLGDAYYPYEEYFQKALGEKLLVAAPHLMYPRAASIASLAMLKLEAGELENLFSLRPHYIRLSEAEYRLGKAAQ
mgnify:FL=1